MLSERVIKKKHRMFIKIQTHLSAIKLFYNGPIELSSYNYEICKSESDLQVLWRRKVPGSTDGTVATPDFVPLIPHRNVFITTIPLNHWHVVVYAELSCSAVEY
jgi:hypothetical protein